MLSTKNSAVNVTFGGKVSITRELKGDQNTMIFAFRELILFLSLGGASAPAGSQNCL
jgi:hypothetical protein